eukprot:bmy_03203T0
MGTRRWPTRGRPPARSAPTSCCSTAAPTSASCSWPPPTCPGRTITGTTAAGGCPPSSEDRRCPQPPARPQGSRHVSPVASPHSSWWSPANPPCLHPRSRQAKSQNPDGSSRGEEEARRLQH